MTRRTASVHGGAGSVADAQMTTITGLALSAIFNSDDQVRMFPIVFDDEGPLLQSGWTTRSDTSSQRLVDACDGVAPPELIRRVPISDGSS
jgi:hypothetical protein